MKKIICTALIMILMLAACVCVSAEGETVSEGKSYTLLTPASTAYPDDGSMLTDGFYGSIPEGSTNYYSSKAYVGFDEKSLDSDGSAVILIDLGDGYDSLAEFTVGYLNEPSAGIVAPESVSFAIADERNGEYEDIGSLDTSKTDSDTPETYADTLTVDAVSGRFVRVTIIPQSLEDKEGDTYVAWTFIDEVSVRRDTGDDETSSDSESDASTDASADASQGTADESSADTSLLDASDVSEDTSTPQTGDDGYTNLALKLLALSAFGITAVLFSKTRQTEKF